VRSSSGFESTAEASNEDDDNDPYKLQAGPFGFMFGIYCLFHVFGAAVLEYRHCDEKAAFSDVAYL